MKTAKLLLRSQQGVVIPYVPPNPGIYGTGIGYDTKDNCQIGPQQLAYKFRASTTSALTGVRFTQRSGPGYSAGNFGIMTVSIRPDNAGKPSSTVLASISFVPNANNSTATEKYDLKTFPVAANLVAGTIYYIVFTGSSTTNFCSVNMIYCFDHTVPRQPRYPDNDFGVFWDDPGPWTSLTGGDTPLFDAVYANGVIDGQCYYEAMIDKYKLIGGTNMAGEHITVTGGNKTVSGAWGRVRRSSGTGPLLISLRDNSGTVIDSVSIPSSSIPISTPNVDSNPSPVWVGGAFASNRVLTNGVSYYLTFSAAAGTVYTTHPQRAFGASPGYYRSWSFTDGVGEYTTNGGTTWIAMYNDPSPNPTDLAFYFTTV